MSVSGIDNMITDFINSITYEALNKLQIPNMSTQDTIDKGVVLRKTVFDRLKSVIGDRKIIFLAPDGDLSRLPFEILPTSDDGRHFLLDVMILAILVQVGIYYALIHQVADQYLIRWLPLILTMTLLVLSERLQPHKPLK